MKRIGLKRVVSLLLTAGMLLGMLTAAPAASGTTLLSEGFDFSDADAGRELLGWNSWGNGYQGGSSTVNVEDSIYTLVAEPDNTANKVLQIERPTSTSASIGFIAEHALTETVTSGIVHYSMRLQKRTTTTSMFRLCLYDNAGAIQEITIDMHRNGVTCESTTFNLMGSAALNTWYTFDIYLDTEACTFTMYQSDGSSRVRLATDVAMTRFNGSIKSVGLSTNRTAAAYGGSNAVFLVDDVSVAKLAAMEMTASQPADGADDVEVSDPLLLTFSQPVDAAALSAANVTISGAAVSSVAVDPQNDKAVLVTPAASLDFETSYTVSVTGISDVYGQVMADKSFSFITRAGHTFYTSPKFYLDYAGAKTDITETGLQAGEVTAEVGITNETDEDGSVVFLLKTLRGGTSVGIVSRFITLPAAGSAEYKATVSATVQAGDTLELLIFDSWDSLAAETGAYTFDASGVTADAFTEAAAVSSVYATMNYDTDKVDITGAAEDAGSTVTLAVLNPGYAPAQITEANTNAAVHSLLQLVSGSDGTYSVSLDSAAFTPDVSYTVVAGGKTATLVIRDEATVLAALTQVKNSTAGELADLLEGVQAFQPGLDLNDVLQLDLSEYLLLAEPEKALEGVAGVSFSTVDALRTAYDAALARQVAYEARVREVISLVNSADGSSMQSTLESAGDVLTLDWSGDYAQLSESGREQLFQALADAYTFTTLSAIETAFIEEAAACLAGDSDGDTGGETVLLKEEFEVSDSAVGREALGWNGWGGGYASGASGTINMEDSMYTIVEEPGNADNKVLQMYRPTSSASSILYALSKDLSEVVSGGVVQLSLRLQRTSASSDYFQLGLYDHASTLWEIQVLAKTSRISCSGNTMNFVGNTGSNPGMPLDTWHNFTFFFNLDDMCVSVYQDDTLLASGISFPTNFKGSIKTVRLNTHRTAAGAGANFLVDDVVLQKAAVMKLTGASPADGAQNVDTAEPLTFTFSQPVDAGSLTTDNVVIEGATVASVEVDAANSRKLVVRPGQLRFDTSYQVLVTGVRDTLGQRSPDAGIGFTTRAGRLDVSEPVFYLDYTGAKTDITATGAVAGTITAEVDMVNETNQAQAAQLVLQTVRRDKTFSAASTSCSIAAGGSLENATVTATAEAGQALQLMVIGSWDTLLAKTGTYTLGVYGLSQESFTLSEAVSKLHAALNYDTSQLEITGQTDTAGATVTLAVLQPGYAPNQITESNTNAAVYRMVQAVSDATGAYSAAIDASGLTENASYTVLASGGKTVSVIPVSDAQIQAALDTVKNTGAAALGSLLTGQQAWQNGLYLNDVLQLDLTDYPLLEDKTKVLGELAGKAFADLEALRTTYNTALDNQLAREARVRQVIQDVNEASWDELEALLKASSDVVTISWNGSYAELREDKRTALYKILARDYTFDTAESIANAFRSEADSQLTLQRAEDSASSSNDRGGGGGGGGGSLAVRQNDEAIQEPSLSPEGFLSQEEGFTDLDTVPWAVESIEDLAERGIVSGVGDGKFAPNDFVTREQFVKMIVLAFGLEGEGTLTFTDADSTAWYAPYIGAAVENNVVQGLGDGRFGIGQYISRSDIAVICTRIAGVCGVTLPEAETADYRDAVLIPAYAQESAATLQAAGIMTGDENKCFNPSANATRAMAAKVIYMLLSLAEAE